MGTSVSPCHQRGLPRVHPQQHVTPLLRPTVYGGPLFVEHAERHLAPHVALVAKCGRLVVAAQVEIKSKR